MVGSGSGPRTNNSGFLTLVGSQYNHAYLSGGRQLGRALTPRLLPPELLGEGLAEALSAAAVGQARSAAHPTVQPRPAAHPTV
jgi:hypothetical protein